MFDDLFNPPPVAQLEAIIAKATGKRTHLMKDDIIEKPSRLTEAEVKRVETIERALFHQRRKAALKVVRVDKKQASRVELMAKIMTFARKVPAGETFVSTSIMRSCTGHRMTTVSIALAALVERGMLIRYRQYKNHEWKYSITNQGAKHEI